MSKEEKDFMNTVWAYFAGIAVLFIIALTVLMVLS